MFTLMKTTSLFIALLTVSTCLSASTYRTAETAGFTDPDHEDSLSHRVEQKIEDALNQAIDDQDFAPLSRVKKEIKQTDARNRTYWKAYLAFQEAVYFLENEDIKKSSKFIQRGIKTLRKADHRTSEDYALLAMMQSFSIQFAEVSEMAALAQQVKERAQKAIELDPNNPRAYYVYAIQDYYTPEEYGGGKETEAQLSKAVDILRSGRQAKSGLSWGEDSSYELLIKYYLNEGNRDVAHSLYEEVVALYPDSYVVENLQGQF